MEQIETLRTELAAVRGEALALRGTLSDHTDLMRRRLRLVTFLLALLALAGGVVAWQLHEQVAATRRSAADQRRLCPLVSLLIPQPGDAPPSTPRGVQMTEAARDYAAAIHC